MKLFVFVLLFGVTSYSQVSTSPAYVSADIVSIERLPDSSGGTTYVYQVKYVIQPCSQEFVKVLDIRLPELKIQGDPEVVTDTSVAVILRNSGILCKGPTILASVLYSPGEEVKHPQPLRSSGVSILTGEDHEDDLDEGL